MIGGEGPYKPYDPDKGPTSTWVLEQVSRLNSYWMPLHTIQQYCHDIYRLALDVKVPDGFKTVYPGTGNSVVEVAADHINGDGPLIKIPVVDESMQNRRDSEKMEKWIQAAFHRFEERAEVPPLRGLIVDLGWAGMAVSQGPLFDPTAWGDDPATKATTMDKDELEKAKEQYDLEKKMRWPLLWRVVDPRYVYADPGTHGRKYVAVQYQRNVGEIRATWPEWIGLRENGELYHDTDEVMFTEWWDEKWKIYIAARDELEKAEHRYGKPPFQIVASGLGKASGLPQERYVPLIWSASNMIEQEIYVACQMDAVMRNAAWTQMMTPIGSNFKQLRPGTTVRMQPEHIEHTKPVTELRPEVIQALMQESQWVDEKIQDSTYPSVVKGIKVPGVGSGYGNNSLASLAKLRFGPMAKAAAKLLQQWTADLLHCVEFVVEEALPVYGPSKQGYVSLTLAPKDIHGTRYVEVDLNPKLPVDKATEIQTGLLLLGNPTGPLIDDDTFLEDFAGYEQPEEMRIRIQRDRILKSPLIQGILEVAAAEEMGLIDWLEEKAQKLGLPPGSAFQAFMQMLPQAQGAAGGAPSGMPGSGPGTAGGGGPAMSAAAPSPAAQPVPGGPADQGIPSQSAAARGAGVPPPGAGARAAR